MSVSDGEQDSVESSADDDSSYRARLARLERQMSALATDVASLRESVRLPNPRPSPDHGPPILSVEIADALRIPPIASPPQRPSLSDRVHAGAAISGDELESLVGRYATLALAALVILMAVGAVIKMAVQRGLLTPEVRVEAGALSAVAIALAGMVFRRRGEMRFGNVLLALSLAIVDLVAWGAGPRLHLVSTHVALTVVDVVAIGLAALAVHDASEFLFIVAVAGALSSPFVTSDGGGTALALLLYGGAVLVSAQRAARDATWMRAFAVLVVGALVYALAATALPMSPNWYGPVLVALFGGACAAAALGFGASGWKSELPRGYLAVCVVGVIEAWIGESGRAEVVTSLLATGLFLAGVTYLALAVRGVLARYWTMSALLLPGVSLGVALAGVSSGPSEAGLFALWSAIAFVAWLLERSRGDWWRSGVHIFEAAFLGAVAITVWLWGTPLELVAGLAGWGVCVAVLSRTERSAIPLWGIALATGAAAVSAIDQLVSRGAYAYTPFATRSSASALCAALGIAVAGEIVARSKAEMSGLASRSVRLGSLIGFLIIWGRMEFANAFNHDLASFLLTSYYAACGVGSIIAGRQLGLSKLRVIGLALAIYAAVKAIVEVTDIDSVLLRVGAYAAVGVFLLGAGYLYRERRASSVESSSGLRLT